MTGLFRDSELVRRTPLPLLPRCGACGLSESCTSPKMPVDGRGRRGILVIGEAPGRTEDENGRPFTGKSGKYLKEELDREGIDLRRDCWVTNSCRCRPPGNKLPPASVEHCRPLLVQAIKDLRPRAVLVLGKYALQSLMGYIWREDAGPLTRWVGACIPCQSINAWVVVTWHPAHLLRLKDHERMVQGEMFRRHLATLSELEGRPHDPVPDYDRMVRRVIDPERVPGELRALRDTERHLALDYETDRLKPDREDARILCCAVSDGRVSVAYPWVGPAVEATRRLLRSPTPKIGYNQKFEQRWTIAKLGCEARNWVFDGMLGAHVLDHRKGVSGLKFQAFVRLGAEVYEDRVKPFMASDNSNAPNSLATRVELSRLLLYCGKDALLEWLVASLMMKELGLWRW